MKISKSTLIEPLSAVNPSTYNPRTADPKRLDLIELSLRKLGFIAPIVGNSQEANSPSMLKMLQNFTNATFRWASAGFKIADDETLAKRQAICDTCQYWKASARLGMGKCLKCGCTSLKLKFDTEKCPAGSW